MEVDIRDRDPLGNRHRERPHRAGAVEIEERVLVVPRSVVVVGDLRTQDEAAVAAVGSLDLRHLGTMPSVQHASGARLGFEVVEIPFTLGEPQDREFLVPDAVPVVYVVVGDDLQLEEIACTGMDL